MPDQNKNKIIKPIVAERRKYAVTTVNDAKKIAGNLLEEYELGKVVTFGLPEIDDRTHIWRIAVLSLGVCRRKNNFPLLQVVV